MAISAGMVWKGEGDQAKRKYDFSMRHNRLTAANLINMVSGSGGSALSTKAPVSTTASAGYLMMPKGNILLYRRKDEVEQLTPIEQPDLCLSIRQ